MQQNTKKILESFKNLNWKRQSAFLDILNDLLITTKPIKTDQSTFEKIMFDKALKDSGVTLEIDKNMSEEEKREILLWETRLTYTDHLDHEDLDKIKEILILNE